MNELVSVIVPSYNRAHCLWRAVDSALQQTHHHVEVIIVDDGSSDNTRRTVEERYGAEPRVRYNYKTNGGAACARNSGLDLARGDYIALLDSDDLWSPWKLELQLACMRENPSVGMTWTDMDAVAATGELQQKAFLRTMYHAWRHFKPEAIFKQMQPVADIAARTGGKLSEMVQAGTIPGAACFYVGEIFSPMLMGSLVHTSTVVLRRDRLERVKSFNVAYTPLGEDYDFHLRTCNEGAVGFIDLPTIKYEVGSPDCLSRRENKLAGAKNCLRIISPWLESGNLKLPASMVTQRLAEVHAWIAEEMLACHDLHGCRKHAFQSLGYGLGRARTWKLLLVSCLPVSVVKRRHARLHPHETGLDA